MARRSDGTSRGSNGPKAEFQALSPRLRRMDNENNFEFICPFCGQPCRVILEPPQVLHATPTCAKFDRLEPDEYLVAVNDKRGLGRA